MYLLLSITFLGFYCFFSFAKTIPDTPQQIWHAAANPSTSLHRAHCSKWNSSFPFASWSGCCCSPWGHLQALPLCPGWCGLLDWEQMADGAGTAASNALQHFPADLGVSCLALQEHKAKGAAVLHPMSQSHFLSSFKISIWLDISQNRHLQVQAKWEQQKLT